MCYSAGMGEKVMGYYDRDLVPLRWKALCWGLGLAVTWAVLA